MRGVALSAGSSGIAAGLFGGFVADVPSENVPGDWSPPFGLIKMSTCISSSGCLLSFCSLGRGEEGREGGKRCSQFHQLCYQLLGSTSTGHGQLLPSWESPQGQCQAGRLMQQDGWHTPIAVRLPALLRWLSRRVGPISSSLSLPWAISSISQRAGRLGPIGRVGESPAGLVPRATGQYNSLAFLPLKLLSYPASVV